MALCGAMRDDIAALEAGVYQILPHRDSSGRQLVLVEPRRNTGDGYSPESMVRHVCSNDFLQCEDTEIRLLTIVPGVF